MSKKIVFLSVLIAILVVLSGCSKKETKLVCTQSASGVDIEFNVLFKGNTVTDMDFNYDMDLSSYSDIQIEAVGKQDFCSIVKKSMSDFADAFKTCEQNISQKHLKVSSILDVDKASKSILDKTGTPKATKEALEKQGYTCTME